MLSPAAVNVLASSSSVNTASASTSPISFIPSPVPTVVSGSPFIRINAEHKRLSTKN